MSSSIGGQQLQPYSTTTGLDLAGSGGTKISPSTDLTLNSLTANLVSSVSTAFTSMTAVTATITNATISGTLTLAALAASGATTLTSLTVSGATSLATLATSGAATLASLTVSGATSLATVATSGLATLASLTVTNNATVGGTLGVTGTTTLGTTAVSSMANSGNETIGGTLQVTGTSTLFQTNVDGSVGVRLLNSSAGFWGTQIEPWESAEDLFIYPQSGGLSTGTTYIGNANSSATKTILFCPTSSTATALQSSTIVGTVVFGNLSTTAAATSFQGGNVRSGSRFVCDGSEDSTNSTTGALQIRSGGAYINKQLRVDGVITVGASIDAASILDLIPTPGTKQVRIGSGNSSANQNMLTVSTSSTSSTLQANSTNGIMIVGGGSTGASTSFQGGNVRTGSRFVVDGTEDSTSSTTGAIQARSGGAYINKTCYIDGTGVTTASSTTTGALQVRAGGAGITGNVYVSGFVSIGATMPLLIARTQLGTTGVYYTKTAAGMIVLDGSAAVGTPVVTLNSSNALPSSARPPNDFACVQVMGGPDGYCHLWVRASTGLIEVTSKTAGTTVYIGCAFYAA